MENKIKTAPPRDSKALSSRRGEDSRFPLEVRADNFFRDARQSFRKRKEGEERLSKIELYVIVLTIVTTSSRRIIIVRPFSRIVR